MKKSIVALISSFVLILTSIVTVYAGYPAVSSPVQGGYALGQALGAQGHTIVDVGCNSANFTYKVSIGLGSLSDICTEANGIGITCSLYFNESQNVYVIRVHDKKLFGLVNTTGVIANANGYVYTAERESGGTTNNTYNYNTTIINPSTKTPSGVTTPSSAPSYWEELEVLRNIYTRVSFAVEYLSLVCDWLNFQSDMLLKTFRQVERNVVPALDAINKNIISFKDSTVAGLKNLDNDVVFGVNVLLEQLNVQNRIYSSVVGIGSRLDALNTNTVGIGSRLDSVISNGAVQVNTTPLEARLDKLISMYSKVNSVVLDTAAINGSQIKAAVGGELTDAVFWGNSGKPDKVFLVSDATYSLNGAQTKIPVQLLGFSLGASVPASFDTSDTALMAGVWRTSGGNYRLADTYNAATGEYVRRVGTVTYDGSEDWKMVAKDGCYLFYLSDPAFSHTNGNIFSMSSHFGYVPYNSAFSGNASDSAIAYNYKFTVFTGKFMIICQSPSVAAWKTWLKQQVAAGTPWTVWYQDVPTATVLDRTAIAIPEGDSAITGAYMRITGKYETYDSYTQTADIIAAINNLHLSSGVGADLTAITTRLDTLINKTSDTVVNVVNNNTYITNVFQLDDDTSVVDTTKDGVGKVSGLFKWLWNNTFKSAFTHADITKLDGLL